MTEQQQVVILDNAGTRHVFPAGFDPARAADIVKRQTETVETPAAPARTWTDTAVDAMPMVGGAAGGIVGGIGGTVAGLGVGGAPGAMMGAGLGGALGESVRQLVQRGRGKRAPETPAEAALEIGKEGALNAAFEGGGQAVGAGMKAAAPWLMAKAVKPSYALLQEYKTTAPALAKTLLDHGVNVTEGGLSKLQGLLRSTNDEIRTLINNSPVKVMKDDVLRRVDELAARTMKTSANPNKALAKATQVADEFVQHPYYKGQSIPVAAAQDLKVGAYKEIGNAFGKPEKAAALKALARGLKEEVATAVPQVADLNAKEASLMAAGEAVAKRVAADTNADPLGILWASHSPEMFIAGIIHKQPIVKSLLARGLWKMAGTTAKVSPQVLRSAVFAMAQGQQPEPEEDEK